MRTMADGVPALDAGRQGHGDVLLGSRPKRPAVQARRDAELILHTGQRVPLAASIINCDLTTSGYTVISVSFESSR